MENQDYPSFDTILEIPANASFVYLDVPIIDDQEVEADELFHVMLYLPSSNTDLSPITDDGTGDAGVSTVALTILDDDCNHIIILYCILLYKIIV